MRAVHGKRTRVGTDLVDGIDSHLHAVHAEDMYTQSERCLYLVFLLRNIPVGLIRFYAYQGVGVNRHVVNFAVIAALYAYLVLFDL